MADTLPRLGFEETMGRTFDNVSASEDAHFIGQTLNIAGQDALSRLGAEGSSVTFPQDTLGGRGTGYVSGLKGQFIPPETMGQLLSGEGGSFKKNMALEIGRNRPDLEGKSVVALQDPPPGVSAKSAKESRSSVGVALHEFRHKAIHENKSIRDYIGTIKRISGVELTPHQAEELILDALDVTMGAQDLSKFAQGYNLSAFGKRNFFKEIKEKHLATIMEIAQGELDNFSDARRP